MKYAIEYIDFFGVKNHEVGGDYLWSSCWDAERIGEIQILRVDGTTDNWETSFEVYTREG